MTKPKRQTRKLQMSGGSTYIVSLPKTWVEEMDVKAGEGVSMIRNKNRSVTIYPNTAEQRRNALVVVGPQDSDGSILRKLVAVYLSGYNTIRISARGIRLVPDQVNTIRNFVRTSMVGTEIVESDPEFLTIQTLTRLPELTFSRALERMCKMTKDMHQEAVDALASADTAYANDVIGLDDEVDRFAFYMMRNLMVAVSDAGTLQEMGLESPADCLHYHTVISRIERIADHAALIARRVTHLSGTLEPTTISNIRSLSDSMLVLFATAVDALQESDYVKAETVSDSVGQLRNRQEEMMASLDGQGPNATIAKFVLESIRRSAEHTMDITEVIMDRNIHSIIASTKTAFQDTVTVPQNITSR